MKPIILTGLEGNDPTRLHGLQLLLEPHADVLVGAWWCVYVATAIIVLVILVRRMRR